MFTSCNSPIWYPALGLTNIDPLAFAFNTIAVGILRSGEVGATFVKYPAVVGDAYNIVPES